MPEEGEEMITMKEILRNGEELYTLPVSTHKNLIKLHTIMNVVRRAYGKPMVVTSGYRSPSYNKSIGGSPKSAHCNGLALDVRDDGKIKDWIKDNIELMELLGLYFEDFNFTKTWVHFTIRPPKSGNRFFRP